jgi:hypothetical protein
MAPFSETFDERTVSVVTMEVVVAPQNAAIAQFEAESEAELFRMQLIVAKRADELAQGGAKTRDVELDRKTWLLAETQVLPGFAATPAA